MRQRFEIRKGTACVGVALALLTCGGGGSRSEPAVVRSQGAEIRASVEPAAPRLGENRLWIELRDTQGEPIPGARIAAEVVMPAMGTMPAMGGPTPVREVEPGLYRAEFELDMKGTWQVQIRAELPAGGRATAEGSLSVGTPGLRLEGAEGAQRGAATGHETGHPHGPAPAPAPGAATAQPAAGHAGEFSLAAERSQRVGVRTTRAETVALTTTIRALGVVSYDETALEDVSLKVRGWVRRLEVAAQGDPVAQGQVLFTLYSPELYAAQQEYLEALRSQTRARAGEAPDRADYLVRAARNRLRLWDVAPADLEALARRGAPAEELPIRAPRGGYVVEKSVVEGSMVEPGQRLYRIAPLERVWIEAEIYESEMGLVREGQAARVELPFAPGAGYDARVAYVLPTLSRETRTTRVRLALENPELALRPGMYANVRIAVERGERLVVPQSAVLYAGERSFVFRALGEGRFRPQAVEVGLQSGDQVEILSGLEAGAPVVSSGTFLIASESRLRTALEQW